jgi:hypothetical protein
VPTSLLFHEMWLGANEAWLRVMRLLELLGRAYHALLQLGVPIVEHGHLREGASVADALREGAALLRRRRASASASAAAASADADADADAVVEVDAAGAAAGGGSGGGGGELMEVSAAARAALNGYRPKRRYGEEKQDASIK